MNSDIRYINGLMGISSRLYQNQIGKVAFNIFRNSNSLTEIPLVLIGGTSQTFNNWKLQLQTLSKTRNCIYYETRGQGNTTLPTDVCSMDVHINDFVSIIEKLKTNTPVDLCGFSFGGRLALAIAKYHPELVHKLVLTGVGTGEYVDGKSIIERWIELLHEGKYYEMIKQCLNDTFSEYFLSKNHSRIEQWIDHTMKLNDPNKLKELMIQSRHDPNEIFKPINCMKDIKSPCLLINGDQDKLVTIQDVHKLADNRNCTVEIVANSGHNVPMEKATIWNNLLVNFLDS